MSTESVGDMVVGDTVMGDTVMRDPVMGDQVECLQTRKWWCFLLSSIFTFVMGVMSVIIVRGIAGMCCKKEVKQS